MKLNYQPIEDLLALHESKEKIPYLEPEGLRHHHAIFIEEKDFWKQFIDDNKQVKLSTQLYQIKAHLIRVSATIQLIELTIKQMIKPFYGALFANPICNAYVEMHAANQIIKDNLFHALLPENTHSREDIDKRNELYYKVIFILKNEVFSDDFDVANMEFEIENNEHLK